MTAFHAYEFRKRIEQLFEFKNRELLKSKLALISLPHTATATEVLMTSVVQKSKKTTV
jgi:hypothetical protein